MSAAQIPVGKVTIDGWLAGQVLTVLSHVKDGYYALAFANGNAAPGFYHISLLRQA